MGPGHLGQHRVEVRQTCVPGSLAHAVRRGHPHLSVCESRAGRRVPCTRPHHHSRAAWVGRRGVLLPALGLPLCMSGGEFRWCARFPRLIVSRGFRIPGHRAVHILCSIPCLSMLTVPLPHRRAPTQPRPLVGGEDLASDRKPCAEIRGPALPGRRGSLRPLGSQRESALHSLRAEWGPGLALSGPTM